MAPHDLTSRRPEIISPSTPDLPAVRPDPVSSDGAPSAPQAGARVGGDRPDSAWKRFHLALLRALGVFTS